MLNGVRLSIALSVFMYAESTLSNVSTPHMTFRPFVTCSFACGLLATLLVAAAPLPLLAASSKGVAVWLTTPDKTNLLAEQPKRLHFQGVGRNKDNHH